MKRNLDTRLDIDTDDLNDEWLRIEPTQFSYEQLTTTSLSIACLQARITALAKTFFVTRTFYELTLNARLSRYSPVTPKTFLIALLNLLDYHDCLFTMYLVANLDLPIDFNKPFKEEFQRITFDLIRFARSKGSMVRKVRHKALEHRNVYIDLSLLRDVDHIKWAFAQAKTQYHDDTNEATFFLFPGINSNNCTLRLFCMLIM